MQIVRTHWFIDDGSQFQTFNCKFANAREGDCWGYLSSSKIVTFPVAYIWSIHCTYLIKPCASFSVGVYNRQRMCTCIMFILCWERKGRGQQSSTSYLDWAFVGFVSSWSFSLIIQFFVSNNLFIELNVLFPSSYRRNNGEEASKLCILVSNGTVCHLGRTQKVSKDQANLLKTQNTMSCLLHL